MKDLSYLLSLYDAGWLSVGCSFIWKMCSNLKKEKVNSRYVSICKMFAVNRRIMVSAVSLLKDSN